MKRYFASACLPFLAFLLFMVGFAPKATAFNPFEPTGTGGNPDQTICSQTNGEQGQSPVCTVGDGSENPLTGSNRLIDKIANIFALITGVAAVIVIIVGGFEYVRSGGESSKVNKAKNTILYAIIGLIVVVVARAAVALAVSRL